jgi:hypothetical protein
VPTYTIPPDSRSAGTTVTIYAQGLTSTVIGNRGGEVIMTVQAV